MRHIGQPVQNHEFTAYLLGGLDTSYDAIVTSISTQINKMTLEDMFNHLLALNYVWNNNKSHLIALPTLWTWPQEMTTDHMLEDIHNTNVSLSTSLMASTTEEGDVAIKWHGHFFLIAQNNKHPGSENQSKTGRRLTTRFNSFTDGIFPSVEDTYSIGNFLSVGKSVGNKKINLSASFHRYIPR